MVIDIGARSDKEAIEVESIQDIVESALVKFGNYDLAKEYIIYRYNKSTLLCLYYIIYVPIDQDGIFNKSMCP